MIKKGELGLAVFVLGMIIIGFFSDFRWLGGLLMMSYPLWEADFFEGDGHE